MQEDNEQAESAGGLAERQATMYEASADMASRQCQGDTCHTRPKKLNP